MFHIAMKRMASEVPTGSSEDGKKKKIKLSHTVRSIVDRKQDNWSVSKAFERVANEMQLHRCFLTILLSIFKGDLQNIKNDPLDCVARCDIANISTFAKMMREKFTDDEFLTGEFLLVCHSFN